MLQAKSATKSATTTKATKALAPKTATKAPETLSPKAPVAKAPATKAKAPVTEYATATQANALATMIRGIDARVEALEARNTANESRFIESFDNMAAVIASLQATIAALAVAPVAPATKAPKTEATKAPVETKAAPANSERGTYDGPSVEGPIDAVLAYLCERAIANDAAGFHNENIAKTGVSTHRVYLRTAENKAFKAAREFHGLSLAAMDAMFSDMFE